MTQIAVETRELSAGYNRIPVLHRASLSVHSGEIVGILGANGAGKTTLLRAISRLIWSTGDVALLGRPATKLKPDKVVRLGVSHVPQGRGTFPELTVRQNLLIGGYTRRDTKAVNKDIDYWLDYFPNLKRRFDSPARLLSGGEQQMLALARALIAKPKLLLLDEPSLGLAPNTARDVFKAIDSIQQREHFACLVVEQHTQLTLEVASRVYILENGVLGQSRSVADIEDDQEFKRAYLGG